MKTYKATVVFFVVTFCFTLVIAFLLFPITTEPAAKKGTSPEDRVQEIIIPPPPRTNDLYLVIWKEGGEVEKIYASEEGAKNYLNENNKTGLLKVEALSNMLWPNNKDISFIKKNE